MKFQMIHTNEKNKDFILLVKELNDEYVESLGDIAINYQKITNINDEYFVLLIFNENNNPIACGAFKQFHKDICEIRRIFVKKPYRRKGIALTIMENLEKIAKKQGYNFAVLETGNKMLMPVAIELYNKMKYETIPNFGVFKGDSNCICMKKKL